MFCKNCGREIDDKAVICPYCGVQVSKVQEVQQQNPTNVLALVGFILSFFIPIAGLVCSILGYRRAPQYNGDKKSLALAGIIISAVGIAAIVISLVTYGIIYAVLIASMAGM